MHMSYVIRQVRSLEELGRVCDVIGAQITPPMMRDDRRFQELWPRFEEDRTLMWLAEEDGGEIVGGALGFRPSGAAVTIRAIGIVPHARRHGLGRRLMASVELGVMKLGARGINLGAVGESRGFYQHLGYAGRGTMMHKGLSLPGRFQEARLRKLVEAAAADQAVSGGP
jgi:GNAT superfamily N-acetyltransferase